MGINAIGSLQACSLDKSSCWLRREVLDYDRLSVTLWFMATILQREKGDLCFISTLNSEWNKWIILFNLKSSCSIPWGWTVLQTWTFYGTSAIKYHCEIFSSCYMFKELPGVYFRFNEWFSLKWRRNKNGGEDERERYILDNWKKNTNHFQMDKYNYKITMHSLSRRQKL